MAEAKTVSITIMRKRDLGGKLGEVAITITESGVPLAATTAHAIPLIDQAENTLTGWLEANGIAMTMSDSSPSSQTRIIAVTCISVTMKDGKKYYKVKGGEYSEHGINFWPEHMKACGIDPRAIPDDGYKFKEATNATVEFVNGKPKRVLKLEKA